VLFALLVLLGAGLPAPADAGAATDRVLIGLDDVRPAHVRAVLSGLGLRSIEILPEAGVVVAAGTPTAARGAQRAADQPGVRWVEPDRWISPAGLTDDPLSGLLWGLANEGQDIYGLPGAAGTDIDLAGAWRRTRGAAATVVAVIDTGVDVAHPDLAPNIWTNPGEIAGNGLDDDGNGYVDDVHGWDFANDDATLLDDPLADSHGTHVAGTIAAAADNGRGIAGVAPGVTVLPLKFLGTDGGWTSDAVRALAYAARAGASVVNASWTGTSADPALRDAIAGLDAVVVAAAGNDATDTDDVPRYPASFDLPNVVSVAAVDNTGALASFSNHGAMSVDLGAPGVGILSTVPQDSYAWFDGTSMAAPYVAGVAALLRSIAPTRTAADVAAAMLATARPIPALEGMVATGGMVDAAAAVDRLAPTVPGPPVGLAAVAFDGGLDLSWSAPRDDGGKVITGYRVRLAPAGTDVRTNSPELHVPGLPNGVRQTVTVNAVNELGAGPGASIEARPVGAAGAPTGLVVTAASHQVVVSWSPPRDDGGSPIAGYEIDLAPSGRHETVGPDARTVGVTELANGTAQEVSVRAVTAAGRGRPATTTVLPVAAPPQRVAGPDRFATAAAIATRSFPDGADTVFVATGRGFPDALAGAAAAAAQGAPIVLVDPAGVPDATATELERLRPRHLVVLGGEAAVPGAVVDDLVGLTGARASRYAGPDRYATGARIAEGFFSGPVPVVYLTTGRSFADALGAGAAGGRLGGPVLLVAPDRIPEVVASALRLLQPQRVVVLGGTSAVSPAVSDAASAVTGVPVERLGGATRYATSAAVAASAFPTGVPEAWVATGTTFPDALAGGAAAGAADAPVLLVPGTGPVPGEVLAEITRLQPGRLVVLGGVGAVSDDVAAALREAMG
jgi:subtilisin family serine protease/putative cell wall-binding protein